MANNASKVYVSLPVFSASYSGLVNGDTAASLVAAPTLTTTATVSSHVLPGGCPITASGASDPDYAITYQPSTLTVTPVPLMVTANNATKVYGAGLPPLTYAIDGFVNGDTASAVGGVPNITTTATASSHMSNNPYPITVTAGPSLFASDYGFSFVGGTLSITPARLIITANNAAKVYGAALATLSASYDGLVNEDSTASLTALPNLSTTATPSSHVWVGGYSITASGANDLDYTITYLPGTLTITAVPLTITANNAIKMYGAPLPLLGVSFSGHCKRGYVGEPGDTADHEHRGDCVEPCPPERLCHHRLRGQ